MIHLPDPIALQPGADAPAAAWPDLVAAHGDLYGLITPPIAMTARSYDVVATSYATLARLYVRGNADQAGIMVRALTSVSAGERIDLRVGSTEESSRSTGRVWQSITTPGSGADPQAIDVEGKVTGGDGVVHGVSALLAPDRSPGGIQASGYTRPGPLMGAVDHPIGSEHVTRTLRGPAQVWLDRPACVWCHLGDRRRAIPDGKIAPAMEHYDTTDHAAVHRSWVPTGLTRPGRLAIDLLVRGSAGMSTRMQIGPVLETFAGPGYHTATLEAGPGWIPLTVAIRTGADEGAIVDTLQIWRLP
jgi:hypothetical protein